MKPAMVLGTGVSANHWTRNLVFALPLWKNLERLPSMAKSRQNSGTSCSRGYLNVFFIGAPRPAPVDLIETRQDSRRSCRGLAEICTVKCLDGLQLRMEGQVLADQLIEVLSDFAGFSESG
jgi:hypothetical protein